MVYTVKLIFLYLVLGLRNTSWAASPSLPSLGVQETDASVAYLSMIFGIVDGVLNGSGSQITGQLLSILSTIILCCAGILWTYVAFVGILNTAAEGQFLGQRWSSMWIPIRVVGGFCLLMPKGVTGYSLIQVIVMSVIVQGIGAANLAWRKTLDYIGEGGTIVESVRSFKRPTVKMSPSLEEVAHYELLEQAFNVLKSEVYMMTYYYALRSHSPNAVPPFNVAQILNLGNRVKSTESDPLTINFPAFAQSKSFGRIEWESNNDLCRAAVEILVLNLLPTAQRMALKVISKEGMQENAFTQGEDFNLVKSVHGAIGMLKIADRTELLKAKQKDQNIFRQKQDEMKAAGWITAGNWYRMLAERNRSNIDLGMSRWDSKIHSECDNDASKIHPVLKEAWQRTNFKNCLKTLDEFKQQERDRLTNYHQTPWISNTAASISVKGPISEWLLNPFQVGVDLFQKRMQCVLNTKKDPIITLSTIGKELLEAVEHTWKKVYQGKFKFSGMLVSTVVDSESTVISPHVDMQNTLGDFVTCLALLPILITWILLNFMLGSILVYYVPLIPFLVFFFRALTWFVAVIIAIVAAPCVALGVISPEGHPVMGYGEQAIRRLVDLFLCPLLMVLGLVCGMILCTVVFELFHYGYAIVLEDIPKFKGVLSGVSQIAITTFYTTAAITIVTRSFALIYELPAKTLSWIGWSHEGHSESDILSQLRNSIDQRIGTVGQSVTGKLVESNQVKAPQSSGSSYDVTIRSG